MIYPKTELFMTITGRRTTELSLIDPLVSKALKGMRASSTNKFIIPEDHRGRPDLSSFQLLNMVDYYRILMEINNVVDPFTEWTPGKIIYYPSLAIIDSYISVLKKEQSFVVDGYTYLYE